MDHVIASPLVLIMMIVIIMEIRKSLDFLQPLAFVHFKLLAFDIQALVLLNVLYTLLADSRVQPFTISDPLRSISTIC